MDSPYIFMWALGQELCTISTTNCVRTNEYWPLGEQYWASHEKISLAPRNSIEIAEFEFIVT